MLIYLVQFTQPDPMGQAYSFTEAKEAYASKASADARAAQLQAEHRSQPLFSDCIWTVQPMELKLEVQ